MTSSIDVEPIASIDESVETKRAAGAWRQAMLQRGQQALGKRQGAAAFGRAHRVNLFKTATQFGRVAEFVKAVRQFDAAVVEFESFGDFMSGVRRDNFGQRGLRRGIVIQNLRPVATKLRLDARRQQQIEPFVAIVVRASRLAH